MSRLFAVVNEQLLPVVELKFDERDGKMTRITFLQDGFLKNIFQNNMILSDDLGVINIDKLTEGRGGDFYTPDNLQALLTYEEETLA